MPKHDMRKCESEHDGHFNGDLHPYGKKFLNVSVRRIKTPHSTFVVCVDCMKRYQSMGYVQSVEYLNQTEEWVPVESAGYRVYKIDGGAQFWVRPSKWSMDVKNAHVFGKKDIAQEVAQRYGALVEVI